MIYTHHGYTEFDCREKYFDDVNGDALAYLTLANKLVHDFRPSAVTIAEDVSGMPGMCAPVEDGGDSPIERGARRGVEHLGDVAHDGRSTGVC